MPRGVKIEKGVALFPRIEGKTEMDEKNETTRASEIASPAEAAGSQEDFIDIDDFRKVDIRIGTVVKAEPVDGSNKLMRLRLDDGMSGRTILAGIAKHVSPEDLSGKQVVFVANLKPRKMVGELSEGMVLAASEGDSLFLLRPTGEVSPGTRVS